MKMKRYHWISSNCRELAEHLNWASATVSKTIFKKAKANAAVSYLQNESQCFFLFVCRTIRFFAMNLTRFRYFSKKKTR